MVSGGFEGVGAVGGKVSSDATGDLTVSYPEENQPFPFKRKEFLDTSF